MQPTRSTHPVKAERLALILPALNEEESVGATLCAIHAADLSPHSLVQVLVVDNGSDDRTAEVAQKHGATVIREPRRGYGRACLKGIDSLAPDVTIVGFMDADGCDDPADLPRLIAPIAAGEADLVLGSRILGRAEPGSLTPQQLLGNRLAVALMRLLYGTQYTDLGPFRCIRRTKLEQLGMKDTDFGWTIEMQIKACLSGLRAKEIPVNYRKRRHGQSKIAGTIRGTVFAGTKILWTVLKHKIT
jgi:glycosyltransferase involved in cell wall biosynthesis